MLFCDSRAKRTLGLTHILFCKHWCFFPTYLSDLITAAAGMVVQCILALFPFPGNVFIPVSNKIWHINNCTPTHSALHTAHSSPQPARPEITRFHGRESCVEHSAYMQRNPDFCRLAKEFRGERGDSRQSSSRGTTTLRLCPNAWTHLKNEKGED